MRLRILHVMGVLLMGCTAAAWAQSTTPKTATAPTRIPQIRGRLITPPSQDTAVRRMLLRRVKSVEWEETPFEEILGWLRDEAGDRINIIPKLNALDAEGVDLESPVTLRLRYVSVATVLNEVMEQLSEDGSVRYRAVGSNLYISTKGEFGKKLETRVYQIADVVFAVPDMGRNAPTIDLEAASRQSSGGGGGGGQSVFGGANSNSSEDLEVQDAEQQEIMDDLRTIIAVTVDPGSWDNATIAGGAGPGTIRILNNDQLVVYATIEAHEKIVGYFTFGK